MAKNYVQEGDVLDYTNGGSAIASGAVVLLSKRIGVAVADIAAGATGAVAVKGVFSLKKKTADTPALGDVLYWDNTNKELTTTASGNTAAGYATAGAGSSDTSVNININA